MALAVLVIVLVVLPIVELYVFIKSTHAFGFWNTLGVLVLISLVGGYLVRRLGVRMIRRFAQQIRTGQNPERAVVDGLCLLVAGLLLILPGFVSDGIAVLLLLPPVRAGVRALVARRQRRRRGRPGRFGPGGPGTIRVIDATYERPDGLER